MGDAAGVAGVAVLGIAEIERAVLVSVGIDAIMCAHHYVRNGLCGPAQSAQLRLRHTSHLFCVEWMGPQTDAISLES